MAFLGFEIPNYPDRDRKRVVDGSHIDESALVFVGDKMRGWLRVECLVPYSRCDDFSCLRIDTSVVFLL